MKRFVAILLLIVLALCLFSCKKKNQPQQDVFYQVTFNTVAFPTATQPEAVTVKEGEAVARPAFDGVASAGNVVAWTKDTATNEVYDFSAPVTESFTLYAVEVPKTYKIIYLLDHGVNSSANPTTYSAASETIVLQPPVYTSHFGYKFIKWAPDTDASSKVEEIPQGTEGDIVLRAVFEPVEYNVCYEDAGDTNPNPTKYLFGTTVTLQDPSKNDHRFLGYTIKWDSGTAVTALTPEFVEAHQEALYHENGVDIYLKANWERLE